MKNLIRFLSVMVIWLFVASTPAIFAVNKVNREVSCDGRIYSCSGDVDCNEMFTKGGCGDLSYCTAGPDGRVFCHFCQCVQRQGSAASKARRFAYIVVAVDQHGRKATVQETKNGPRASPSITNSNPTMQSRMFDGPATIGPFY